MAVRREAVRLELQDAGFSTGMARAAAATALLDRSLNDLDGSTVRTRTALPQTSRDINTLAASSRSAGPEIDRLSGRMRIFADAALVLGPALAPISAVAVPALTGLASQLGFAAVGMTSLVVASQGVGEALKAVNDAALEPTSKNLEKAELAMGRLGPEAQAFVSRFQELRPVLTDIRDASARGWFPGLTESMDYFEQVAPRVASLFERIGEVGGGLVAEAAEGLAGPEGQEFLAFVERNAPQALEELGRTAGNLARGLGELWMAFDPLNDSFSSWMLDASRGFADWADGLAETEGFQEFIEYVQTNGPRVAEAAQAVASAVVEIVEAVAPLGGPSLAIIEGFANGIAAIADSDLGTPILAGAAALAVYNRALQVTTALQTRMGVTGAAAAGGGLLGLGPGGNIRRAGSDLMAYAALRSQVVARTTAETARMNAASASLKTNMAGMAKSAAPAAAGLAAIAAVSTETGQSLVGTNTAMLTLVGSMAGPWGALAGATVGNFLDLKASIDSVGDALEAADSQAASSALLQQRQDTLSNPLSYLTGKSGSLAAGDVWSKLTTGETLTSKLMEGASGKKLDSVPLDEAIEKLAVYNAAAAASASANEGLSASMRNTAAAAGLSNSAVAAGITALHERTNAALGAFGAETQWRQAMRSAKAQADSNNAGLRGNSDAVLANRSALEGLAGAWNNQSEAVRNNVGRFKQARKTFIDTAVAMGVPREAARGLANQLMQIPKSKKVDLLANDQASGVIRGAVAALGGFQSKTITLATIRKDFTGADGGTVPELATGGTVSGQRYPYGDKVHAYLAPGEEVISNRYGQADRHRDLLKAINANRLADGGTVQSLADGGTARGSSFASDGGVARALRGLRHELELAEKAVAKERTQRDALISKRSELASSVGDRLRSDLFGGSEWGSASPFDTLRGDIATGRQLKASIAQLKAKGLRGDALAAVLDQGPMGVANTAAMSKAQLREFQRLYKVRESVATSVSQYAGGAAFNRDIRAETRQLQAELKELRAIKKAIEREHDKDRRSQKKGAGSAGRGKSRGYMK